MPMYEVDFDYKIEEYGTVQVEARDNDEAEDFAREHIAEAYPEVTNISINVIREIR